MYAINLASLHAHCDTLALKMLVGPVLGDEPKTVECERGKMDGMGIVLDCDDERAEAIIYVIRKKYKRNELRCYHSTTGNSWNRI